MEDLFKIFFVFSGFFIFLYFFISSVLFSLIKKDTKRLAINEKIYTEKDIFFYAKKRIADVFNVSINEIDLDGIIGEGNLMVKNSFFPGENEIDILTEDIEDAAWSSMDDVIEKMFPGENRKIISTPREFCEYMVFCYRYCTKDSYKMILQILNCEVTPNLS